MDEKPCWECGNIATAEKYGYPVCDDCKDNIDPELLEEVLIESLKEGHIVPRKELNRRKKAEP